MKAVVFHGKDAGLKIEDIPVPRIKDDEILGYMRTEIDLNVDPSKEKK